MVNAIILKKWRTPNLTAKRYGRENLIQTLLPGGSAPRLVRKHDPGLTLMNHYFSEIDYDQLFGSDSGEDEDPGALRSYFVDLPEFKKFYEPANPLVIVRGEKEWENLLC